MLEPPVVRNGVMEIKDRLGIFGPRKDFTEDDISFVKLQLETYEAISYDQLIREGMIKIGQLKTVAIIEYLLNTGDIFEPICGYLSLTAGGRI